MFHLRIPKYTEQFYYHTMLSKKKEKNSDQINTIIVMNWGDIACALPHNFIHSNLAAEYISKNLIHLLKTNMYWFHLFIIHTLYTHLVFFFFFFLSRILYFKSRHLIIILSYHTYFSSWMSLALHIPSFNFKTFNSIDKIYSTHYFVWCKISIFHIYTNFNYLKLIYIIYVFIKIYL